MTWFRVDDGFPTHPKVLRIPRGPRRLLAVGAWTLAGAWVSDNELDGHIAHSVLDELAIGPKVVADLVNAGLWEQNGEGYLMHDYLDYNPSAEKVAKDRAEAAERQRKGREAARAKRAAETAASQGQSQGPSQRDSQRDSQGTSAVVTVPPTRPDPTRPVLPTEVLPQTPSVGRRGKRAPTPPPETFELDDKLRAWGREHAPHVTDPAAETRQFLDHARANGKTFSDWTAAWRTWMGNAERYALERRGNGSRQVANRTTADPRMPEHDERKALFQ